MCEFGTKLNTKNGGLPKSMAKIVQVNAIVFGYFVRQIAEQRNVYFSKAAL